MASAASAPPGRQAGVSAAVFGGRPQWHRPYSGVRRLVCGKHRKAAPSSVRFRTRNSAACEPRCRPTASRTRNLGSAPCTNSRVPEPGAAADGSRTLPDGALPNVGDLRGRRGCYRIFSIITNCFAETNASAVVYATTKLLSHIFDLHAPAAAATFALLAPCVYHGPSTGVAPGA